MGVGNFFTAAGADVGSKLYGVESRPVTRTYCKQLYPKADITIAGFETMDSEKTSMTSLWATSRSDNIR